MWSVAIPVNSAERSIKFITCSLYQKYKFGGGQFLESKINIYSGDKAD